MLKSSIAEVILKIDSHCTSEIPSDETSEDGSAPMTLPNLPNRLTEDDIVSAISEKTTDTVVLRLFP